MKIISNLAKNQVVVSENGKTELFSYGSLIATSENGKITLTSLWDYSATTKRYLCKFLGLPDKKIEIERRIKDGVYNLQN